MAWVSVSATLPPSSWAFLPLSGAGALCGTARPSTGARADAGRTVRRILTTGLLASATFLLVAVQSFHREPEKDFLTQNSGSGGCSLLAETDVSLFQDLNNEKVRRDQLNIPANAVNMFRD